jgi:uncharacterized protein YbjT (DUF2867 family)
VPERRVLVAGASGFVGSRLVPELVRAGWTVRALSRRERDAQPGVESAVGDVQDRASLDEAFEGVDAAYYLVHGLADTGDLAATEIPAARNFGAAAREAGVERVIYLGGLAHGDDLSDHLRTRHLVGEALRETGPNVLELRASVIVGEGSASFELVRALVDYLPALVLPDWIETQTQPIALDDVIAYLLEGLELPLEESRSFEIGGADAITYGRLLELYGEAVGADRPTVTLPALPLPLPSLLTRFAPEQARVSAQLAEGLRFHSAVLDEAALEAFDVRPRGVREAIRDVLEGGPATLPR